eukprot:XP_015578914.1 transcription factor HHO5-like [Ricinus communis]
MASSSNARSQFDLALGLKLSYVPKSIPNLIKDLSRDESSDEVKILILNDYLLKFREELIFAAVFNQELPHCRLLLLDAIELLKEEIRRIKKGMGLDVADKPGDINILATRKNMSFEGKYSIDLNNPYTDNQHQWSNPTDHHHQHDKMQDGTTLITNQAASLSLAPSPREKQDGMDLKLRVNDRKLMKYKLKPLTQPICRNNRRSWTPELHARFVVVLHMLGGPEVATPKQIRDQMQVEGLTTNQVKSHLQKYRLNWRKIPDTVVHGKAKLYCSDLLGSSGEASTAMDDID